MTPTTLTAFLNLPELRRLYTYEQAMQIPHIATALRNTAEAMQRAEANKPENFQLEQPCAA